jgi:hypothetical protein
LILADTNVLVYAINTDAPQHTTSRAFIEAIQQKSIDGVLVGQVLLEFYAVVTNHRRVARPLEPETAWEQVNALRTIFPVIEGGLKSFDILKEIGKKTKGADIFDTFLVAQMKACGISLLCTYNIKDFSKFEGIIAKTPEEILALY